MDVPRARRQIAGPARLRVLSREMHPAHTCTRAPESVTDLHDCCSSHSIPRRWMLACEPLKCAFGRQGGKRKSKHVPEQWDGNAREYQLSNETAPSSPIRGTSASQYR
eukprot:192237-Rhodomonas_salina.2